MINKNTLLVLLMVCGIQSYAQIDTPTENWTFTTGNEIRQSTAALSLDESTVYIGSNDDSLYAINVATGTKEWAYFLRADVESSPVVGPDGTIYAGAQANFFYAINPDGSLKWETALSNQFLYASAAVGRDGTIYAGARNDSLYAFNPDDGSILWAYRAGDEFRGSAAVGPDGTVYVGCNDDSLYAINHVDGTRLWATNIGGNDEGGLAIADDGTLYIGSSDDNLYSIDPLDGSINWSFETPGGDVLASPVIGSDGTVYVGSRNDSLYAINRDGSEKWRFFAGDEIRSTAAIDDEGIIYFGSYDANVYGLRDDVSEATVVFQYTAGDRIWCPISMTSEGTLLFGGMDGVVYSVTPTNANGLSNAQWAKHGKDQQHTALTNEGIFWTGDQDSDWNNANNWGSSIPTIAQNAIIRLTGNAPTIVDDAVVNDITVSPETMININSGGSLAIMGHASGNATVSRNTAGSDGYSIVGTPVTGEDLSSLVSQGANFIFGYNGSDFVSMTSGSMAPGQGYFMAQVGVSSPMIEMSGSLVSGDVAVDVSPNGDGFNILANPYTAAISAADIINADAVENITTGSIYVWDDGGTNSGQERVGNYRVVNNMGTSDLTNIGSVQGFFVQADNGGILTLTPDMQSTTAGANSDANFYRKAEKQIIKLVVSGNGLAHETVVGFVAGATTDRDYSLDAQYLKGNEYMSFYSVMNDVKFATQALPIVEHEAMEVALGMDLSEAGEYMVAVDQLTGFSDNLVVTLIDQLTGITHVLTETSTLSFSTQSVENSDRFKLSVSPKATLSSVTIDQSMLVYGNASELTIQFPSDGSELVRVFSMDGKIMYSDHVLFNGQQAIIHPDLNRNQVYILTVGGHSAKFIIK